MFPGGAVADGLQVRLEFGAGATIAIGDEALDGAEGDLLFVDALTPLTVTPERLSRRTGATLATRISLDLFGLHIRDPGDLKIFAGVQGFGLWALNAEAGVRDEFDSLGLPSTALFDDIPFAGKQTVFGAAGILGWSFAVGRKIDIRGYGGVGAARSRVRVESSGFVDLDDSAIVPAVVAGLGIFREIGTGWQLGATLDYTRVAGFDLQQPSGATSVFGGPVGDAQIDARSDLIVGLALRYALPEFGL